MQGLLEEGDEIIKDYKGEPACDAALICAAQKVEHYEIASYGTLCTWAELLDQNDALELLQKTLAEEKETDENLTELAESTSNPAATDEDGRDKKKSEMDDDQNKSKEQPRSKRIQMAQAAGNPRKR